MTEGGAIPFEEFGVLESEVHHLQKDFAEHKADGRERQKELNVKLDFMAEKLSAMSSDIRHVNKVVALTFGVAGPVLLVILSAVVTRLFGH